jgi:hypothetical protein
MVQDVIKRGLAVGSGEGREADPAVAAGTTWHAAAHTTKQLYFRVLQHVLQTMFPAVEVQAGRVMRQAVPPAAHAVLCRPDFHLGLLHCSLQLVRSELKVFKPTAQVQMRV